MRYEGSTALYYPAPLSDDGSPGRFGNTGGLKADTVVWRFSACQIASSAGSADLRLGWYTMFRLGFEVFDSAATFRWLHVSEGSGLLFT